MSKEIYSGTINRVVYEADDFKIVRIVLDGADDFRGVTAKGHFPAQAIVPGSWVSFEGKWVNDPKYGKQLQVQRSPVAVQDWTNEKVLAALTAHKVGPTARGELRLAAMDLGLPIQEFLDNGDLSSVSGMDKFAQEIVLATWQSLRTYLDAASFMADAGIPPRVVSKVWSMFGSDIEALLLKDPWVLVQVPGIKFAEVDQIAIRMGVPLDNPGRARGAVLASVQETLQEGHVFATPSQAVARVNTKISEGVGPSEIAQAIRDLAAKSILKIDRTTAPGTTAIYDVWHFETETTCANLLAERMAEPLPVKDLKDALCGAGGDVLDAFNEGAELEELAKISTRVWAAGQRKKTTLTPDQLQAATNAWTSQISLLTGLPGTGKTTTLRAVVSIARDANIPFLLVAPTGIAAKRMASVTGAPASTIHRAFGASGFMEGDEVREANYAGVTGTAKTAQSGGAGQWEYGPGNPHPAQFMVVDESSMLDLHMLYRLLSGTSRSCRILFVGDPFQLPAVGAGDVLRDLGKVSLFPSAHLTKIFRQEGTSGIVLAAHAVHAGRTPIMDGGDFRLFKETSDSDAANTVVKIATVLHKKKKNFQVLSPRHGGDAGVTELNQLLRLALNPSGRGLKEMRLSGSVVREGDRVMVVQNNYDLGVYNGDVGTVATINTRLKYIDVRIHDGPEATPKIVKYEFKVASKSLRLAYAQTVHKSQGQEYDIIVIPVLMSYGRQLQRNLFYTAITRAKEKVFIVGETAAVAKAVRNNKSASRNTLLDLRVRALLLEGGS